MAIEFNYHYFSDGDRRRMHSAGDRRNERFKLKMNITFSQILGRRNSNSSFMVFIYCTVKMIDNILMFDYGA